MTAYMVAGVALIAFSFGLLVPSWLVEARRWVAERDAREDAADRIAWHVEQAASDTPLHDGLRAERLRAELDAWGQR